MVVPAPGSPISTRYRAVRSATESLCRGLQIEDYQLQSMPDCSPPKWHLAHSTWFFETFVLSTHEKNFRPFHPQFCYLFNSYYHSVGDRWARPMRGLLSRPTVEEVYRYRKATDERLLMLIDDGVNSDAEFLIELGLNHEQQHQELLLTDLKHAFGLNPMVPVYSDSVDAEVKAETPLTWHAFDEGVRWVGFSGSGFSFDNESPSHRVWLDAFEIALRPVNNREYLEFIDDGGYERPELWLSDGWAARQSHGWQSPLYWKHTSDGWTQFTLRGERRVNPASPVCHLSYYEADAFARWAGARLPTEREWEVAAGGREDSRKEIALHPTNTGDGFFGQAWQWTGSPYDAYPGFVPTSGGLGEYNGKFMCNQMVLRGSSCVTPPGHSRATYRNFFPPDARWQFSGLRLARNPRR